MKVANWRVLKHGDKNRKDEIIQKYRLGDLAAKVAVARGYDNAFIANMLKPKTFSDPFLLTDMDKAILAISSAVSSGVKIAVYGDYDCDGVCASVVLYDYFSLIGADVFVYIPNRDEGYGLSKAGVDAVHKKGAGLIVTVDNGITAVEEAEYAYSLGMKMVITDHHKQGEVIPKAEAVVDPNRQNGGELEYKDMCGCMVAFKLIAAMEGGDYKTAIDVAGELTAIATLGDIMPLVSENRTVVTLGLNEIRNTGNIGIKCLMDCLKADKREITPEMVIYGICPRINAAGRLNDANSAFCLLTCDDFGTAQKLAAKIDDYNTKRKQLQEVILNKIDEAIKNDESLVHKRILTFVGDGWDTGVIGIAAGKLANLYGKPVIVISKGATESVGSARSVKDYVIYDALKAGCRFLKRWGGHKSAGGFTVDNNNLEKFINEVDSYAADNHPPLDDLIIDAELDAGEINVKEAKKLRLFEPFGNGSRRPLFLMKGADFINKYPLKDGKFTKLSVSYRGRDLYLLYFKKEFSQVYLTPQTKTDIVVSMDVNEYKGEENTVLTVQEIKPAGLNLAQAAVDFEDFETIFRGENPKRDTQTFYFPKREDFVFVYRYLKEMGGIFKGGAYELYQLVYDRINICKLSIVLEVFSQNNLIKIGQDKIEVVKEPKRVSLDKDLFLNKIKQTKGVQTR